MIDKHLTTFAAKLRVKRFMWPKADDPDFIKKITRRQQQAFVQPRASLMKGLEVTREEVDGCDCVTISPKSPAQDRLIFYIHGGAFVFPITSLHWKSIVDIVRKSNVPVVVPFYPFVPEHTYKDIQAHIKRVYEKMTALVNPSLVSVIGDSAGGNLALILPFLVNKDRQPGRIIALSPVVDLSADNPLMDIIEPTDPLLPLAAIRLLLPRYYAEKISKDPIISPLFADYKDVRSELHILNGGKDILSPDITLFHDMLMNKNVRHAYVFERDLPHAWPILLLRSASRTRTQIAKWCG